MTFATLTERSMQSFGSSFAWFGATSGPMARTRFGVPVTHGAGEDIVCMRILLNSGGS